MLKGIRQGPFAKGLRAKGFSVWVYTPIGRGKRVADYAARRFRKGLGLASKGFSDWLHYRNLSKGKWLE